MSERSKKVIRIALYILSIIVVASFLTPTIQVLRTIQAVVVIEALALLLSSAATYLYTELEFRKYETVIPGYIFLGVHVLVGLVVFGIYFTHV